MSVAVGGTIAVGRRGTTVKFEPARWFVRTKTKVRYRNPAAFCHLLCRRLDAPLNNEQSTVNHLDRTRIRFHGNPDLAGGSCTSGNADKSAGHLRTIGQNNRYRIIAPDPQIMQRDTCIFDLTPQSA